MVPLWFKRDALATFRRNLPPARVAMLTCSEARLPTSGVRMQRLRLRRMHQAKHRISVGKASDTSKLLLPTGALFELTTVPHVVVT